MSLTPSQIEAIEQVLAEAKQSLPSLGDLSLRVLANPNTSGYYGGSFMLRLLAIADGKRVVP